MSCGKWQCVEWSGDVASTHMSKAQSSRFAYDRGPTHRTWETNHPTRQYRKSAIRDSGSQAIQIRTQLRSAHALGTQSAHHALEASKREERRVHNVLIQFLQARLHISTEVDALQGGVPAKRQTAGVVGRAGRAGRAGCEGVGCRREGRSVFQADGSDPERDKG